MKGDSMQGKHKKILLYICIGFIFLVLSHYRVVANCSPFAIAFLFALLQNNFNPYVLIVTFFISGILVSIDMSAVLILASQMVFAFLFYSFPFDLKIANTYLLKIFFLNFLTTPCGMWN